MFEVSGKGPALKRPLADIVLKLEALLALSKLVVVIDQAVDESLHDEGVWTKMS